MLCYYSYSFRLFILCGVPRILEAQYSAVQYSAVQYSTVQHSTVQCSTVQYSTAQYSALRCTAVWYGMIRCRVVLHCELCSSSMDRIIVTPSQFRTRMFLSNGLCCSAPHATFSPYLSLPRRLSLFLLLLLLLLSPTFSSPFLFKFTLSSFFFPATDESHWTSKAAPGAPGPQGTGSSELLGEVTGADVIIIDDIVGK